MKSVEIIIPVLNEEKSLATSVSKLNSFLDTMEKKYTWIIHIVDNGSEDSTPLVGDELQKNLQELNFLNYLNVVGAELSSMLGPLVNRI